MVSEMISSQNCSLALEKSHFGREQLNMCTSKPANMALHAKRHLFIKGFNVNT